MNLQIRDARPEDADGRGYVHYKSWQETYKGRIPDAALAGHTLEKCREIARSRPDNTLVAQLCGQIVGFACYGPCRDPDLPQAGEVMSLYLLRQAQGMGVGRQLMDAALEKLAHYDTIALWVLRENAPAIEFYRHYGFRPDGRSQEISVGTVVRMLYRRQ